MLDCCVNLLRAEVKEVEFGCLLVPGKCLFTIVTHFVVHLLMLQKGKMHKVSLCIFVAVMVSFVACDTQNEYLEVKKTATRIDSTPVGLSLSSLIRRKGTQYRIDVSYRATREGCMIFNLMSSNVN